MCMSWLLLTLRVLFLSFLLPQYIFTIVPYSKICTSMPAETKKRRFFTLTGREKKNYNKSANSSK